LIWVRKGTSGGFIVNTVKDIQIVQEKSWIDEEMLYWFLRDFVPLRQLVSSLFIHLFIYLVI
jgi:hypothetical protein